MPAVNLLLPTAPAAAGDNPDHDAGGLTNSNGHRDDFQNVMQATLDGPGHKPSGKAISRPDKNAAAAKAASTNRRTATGASESPVKGASQPSAAKSRDPATAPADTSTAPSASWLSEIVAPPPVLFSLPLFPTNSFAGATGAGHLPAGSPADIANLSAIDASAADGPAAKSGADSGSAAVGVANALKNQLAALQPSNPDRTAGAPQRVAQPTEAAAGNKAKPKAASDSEGISTLPPVAPESGAPRQGADEDKIINPKALGELSVANASAPVTNDGTGVATTGLPMKNSQKTNKVAGPDVKDLPTNASLRASQKNLPALPVASVRPTESRGSDLNFSFSGSQSQSVAPENSSVISTLDLPSLGDARVRTLERTQDMIALHAMRLVESKTDALSVILKPSVGTELSLELRHSADGIEAQVTLTQGDHQLLSKHWPELQERMEQRGIKLAALDGSGSFSSGGNSQSSRQQAADEEAAQRASAFAEFAAAGNFGGASARVAVVHEGWESWA
jgi:hypothetical protein